MKVLRSGLSAAALVLSCQIVCGQAFVNLDFENTTLTAFLVNPYIPYYAINATLPGWNWSPLGTFGNGDPNTTVAFNNIALDAPYVTLQGSLYYPPIQGSYALLLQGGTLAGGHATGNTNGAFIFQSGQIPSSAKSISYWGSALQVTFNGQPLAFYAISNAPNYTIWGGDISAYAGQTGQLLFNAPWQTSAFLDNIQFSPSPWS
jgi:hypothetical protein